MRANLIKEMGLGKTLSTLALICWDLDAMADRKADVPEESRTTLVVAPKSSKLGLIRLASFTLGRLTITSTYQLGNSNEGVGYVTYTVYV